MIRFLMFFAVFLFSFFTKAQSVIIGRTTGTLPHLEYGLGADRLGGAKMTYLDTNVLIRVVDSIEDKSLDDGTFDININEDSVNLAQKIVDEFHFIDIKKIKTRDFDGSLRLDKNSILVFSNIFDLNTSYSFDGPNYNFDEIGRASCRERV